MTQDFQLPDASTKRRAAVLERINPALLALRSGFEGASLPPSPVEGQVANPSNGLRYVYRGGEWKVLEEHVLPVFAGQIAGTTRAFVFPQWRCDVVDVTVLSSVGTTSDGSNNWSLQVTNKDTALNLFSSAPSTNGAEIVADAPWIRTPNQALTVEEAEVLELVLTETGAATTLTRAAIFVRVRRRFD